MLIVETGYSCVTVEWKSTREYYESVREAIDKARTYSELRALLPPEEWAELLERLPKREEEDWPLYDAPICTALDFDWDTPFEAHHVQGYWDGDYPLSAERSLDSVLPEELLRKYATREAVFSIGDIWDIPLERVPDLVDDLRAMGYRVAVNRACTPDSDDNRGMLPST